MASGLLLLLDDVASLLDDVSVMTKIAAKKTAGVLGDDLALNAQQVSGTPADRELPVVWAVAKGSLVNKAILVPGALLLSTFAPWAVIPLMVAGGVFLCFEGVEKIVHKLFHRAGETAAAAAAVTSAIDPVAYERQKIRGAIRTDFILSAEIVVITLGIVADADFSRQLGVLVSIALAMTVGVYGLVAGIVKLDDAGLYLSQRSGGTTGVRLQRSFGRGILAFAPWLMHALSVVGTLAMFLVGGGILTHSIPALAAPIEGLALSGNTGMALRLLIDASVGVLAGLLALLPVSLWQRLRST